MIDQRKLPASEVYVTCRTASEMAKAIKTMVIRGAPAIGVAAAMGIALGMRRSKATGTKQFATEFQKTCDLMAATRPTAVNLFWAIDRMKHAFAGAAQGGTVYACQSTIDRFIWDGDQLVAESRGNGAQTQSEASLNQNGGTGLLQGWARYTHAGGIDEPLAVWGSNVESYGVVPHFSWRGNVEAGSDITTGALLENGSTPWIWPTRYKDIYLAPEIDDIIPGNAHQAMLIVGVIEIVAGLVVAVRPKFGGYLVAAWLGGIIVNLLLQADYYDIALRDFGLLLAALSLARLATAYDRSGTYFEPDGERIDVL